MTWPEFYEKIQKEVHPGWIALAALLILAGIYTAPIPLRRRAADERFFQRNLSGIVEQAVAAEDHMNSLEGLKRMDLEMLKSGLAGHALSQKSLFETGLSLEEEKRLLEKQLEIMSTYLNVDPALQRVFIMRDDQPLQSYLMGYVPIRAFGGASASIPGIVRIVSKERFAHPERGKSEEVNGQLQYTPPQVGTSVRSNALGEFVMFTNSGLIIHGPPLNEEDHKRFPHICLGLDKASARKLYRASFIGTKIVLSHLAVETVPVPEPLQAGATQATRISPSSASK